MKGNKTMSLGVRFTRKFHNMRMRHVQLESNKVVYRSGLYFLFINIVC